MAAQLATDASTQWGEDASPLVPPRQLQASADALAAVFRVGRLLLARQYEHLHRAVHYCLVKVLEEVVRQE